MTAPKGDRLLLDTHIVLWWLTDSDELTDANQDENVATLTLTEGMLPLDDIEVQLSTDGSDYYVYSPVQPVPNDSNPGEWNAGEALIINEADIGWELADGEGNWYGTEFHVKILFGPYYETVYSDQITLEESASEGPTAIFLTKNHSDTLTNATQDDDVATITIVEGGVKLNEIELMISSDGDAYSKLEGYTPIPNNDPTDEWNVGESVVVNEADLPANMTDANGNWPSEDFYVRIIYIPSSKLIYSDHVVLEMST